MPETKTTRPAAGDQWTKRLKLNHSAAAISLAQPAPKSAAQLSTASTETTHAESCHLLSFASAREIVGKASVPILDLTDRETAIIQVTHTASVDVSEPISAANTAAAYQLQRIKSLGATLSTSVIMCRHSAIPKPVVAKVLRYKGDSASKLARVAEQYIVSLQAFDGRMFASYLELLPGSLFRGIRPRIERYTKVGGTPGALLFSEVGNDIVRLVAIPIKPQSFSSSSDVVASTAPSPQPQNKCLSIEATAGDSPQEMQGIEHRKRKADGEVHVDTPPRQKLVETESDNANDDPIVSSATFSNLPTELHRQIFDCMEYLDDVVCLGLTSRYFWDIARDYLHAYYASCLGQWAGVQIVFVGENVGPKDYPPALFSAEEVDQLLEEIEIPLNYDYPTRMLPRPVEMTLFQFTIPLFADKQKFVKLSEEAMDVYVCCRDRNRAKYDPALNATFRELIAEDATYFPRDQPWILRNLTAKEFVRSEAIALRPEFIHGPFIDGFGFGEVIISRICWSTFPCSSMNCAVPIHRGVWAGHGFDITTLAKHRAGTTEAEWRDVSEEVASEIAIICEAKYGPDWREIICKQHGS
ncbi:hypothetical protein TrVFT333_001688 [Trichoderma virens FT-333]|nr:hypothetical protein TrVFT333_001688 [Trichoderma virens FT-333]